MPVYTSDALILRTYKLGEADRIVVFLTRDRGKKRGVAKGARRPRSRYMGALEPMTRGEVAYFEREQRDLVRLNYVEPQRSPLSGAVGRGARARRVFRRADRRVGAGGARRRAAVPARLVDGRRDRRRARRSSAGAVLRVLAAAAAGRVSGAVACVDCAGDAARDGRDDAAAGSHVRLPALCAVRRRDRRCRRRRCAFWRRPGRRARIGWSRCGLTGARRRASSRPCIGGCSACTSRRN